MRLAPRASMDAIAPYARENKAASNERSFPGNSAHAALPLTGQTMREPANSYGVRHSISGVDVHPFLDFS
jgi:hypothetical protein